MIVNMQTLETITFEQLKMLFPNTSFPPEESLPNESISSFGYAVLEYDPAPPTTLLQGLDLGKIYEKGGHYYQSWVIRQPTTADWIAYYTPEIERLSRLCNAQVTALQGRVDTLNDAIDLEMATPEEEIELPARVAQLKQWKLYRIAIGRVTTQVGWPSKVTWPPAPEPYTSEQSRSVE